MTSLVDETDHADLTEYNRQSCTGHMKGLMVALTADAWQQDITLYLICGVAFSWSTCGEHLRKFTVIKTEKGSLADVQAIGAHVSLHSTLSARFLRGQAPSL